jgi:primary-amine oxidase
MPRAVPASPRTILGVVLALCCAAAAPVSARAQGTTPTYPLDPLTASEITRTVEILRASGKADSTSELANLSLREPPKAQVLAWKPGDPLHREAFAVIYDRAHERTSEAVVDLDAGRVVSFTPKPGVQPPLLPTDYALIEEIVRSDPRWQEAMRKRGITHFDSVQVDPWSAGWFDLPGEKGVRLWRALSYLRGSATNAYARPIEGVVAYVDVHHHRLLKLIDTGVRPIGEPDDYDTMVGAPREAPAPLAISQPEGPSFTMLGNEIRWQHWRFRYAVVPREGLVLYTVGYEDHGRVRPVLYRASLSEMVVPYGNPDRTWFFRNAFDEGEYGLCCWLTAPLDPSVDAPANARYLDAVFADVQGKPVTLHRAAALYERDGGTLWKHVTETPDGRRARELVLAFVTTVGNYEYGFHWIFHQDGVLEQQVELNGILQTEALADSSDGTGPDGVRHATVVAPHLAAAYHQHFFNFRLDLDVDGQANSVAETNVTGVPVGANNPYGGAFATTTTPLRRELDAQRKVNPATARVWTVINPAVKNALGAPVGYMLMPGATGVPYADPSSSVRKRAGFLNANLWVTPYDASEMHAAGDYINQNPGGDGLVRWTRANRAVENRDIVVWYTFGMTHIPRPEEWPVMAMQHVGFQLMPAGFFSRNPALDVPKPRDTRSVDGQGPPR